MVGEEERRDSSEQVNGRSNAAYPLEFACFAKLSSVLSKDTTKPRTDFAALTRMFGLRMDRMDWNHIIEYSSIGVIGVLFFLKKDSVLFSSLDCSKRVREDFSTNRFLFENMTAMQCMLQEANI